MEWRGIDAYAADLQSAAADLASALSRGELALFLGAGVSLDAQLPDWQELVKRCCIKASLPFDDINSLTPSENLRMRMDRVEELLGSSYRSEVADALYDKYEILREPTRLLQAIGALVMGSRRGSVRDVVTLNFDDVLESYLALHGFIADVIVDPQRLRRSVDVSVFHPNGYLPRGRPSDWSPKIVFSEESFNETLGEETTWKTVTRQLLINKVVFAVGLSFRDPILKSLVAVAKKAVAPEGRPVAFWLVTGDADDDVIGSMKKSGVVPLRLDSHKDIPDYLLKICQNSAERMRDLS